jgi:tRNA threonylcarbamoyladenosine biosynthesis protein TsaB
MFDPSHSHLTILSLDTCGSCGSVALGRLDLTGNALEIVGKAGLPGRSYSAQLIPKIEELLAAQHATVREIQAIVVVRGPGSFTGIRVGLSAAKGLAEAMGVGIVALSRLALLAVASGLPHVLAAVEAGRGEYYVGEYRNGENLGERLLSGAEVAAAARKPGAGVLVYEAGSTGAADPTGSLIASAPVYLRAPDAADALGFAVDRLRAGSFEDIESLDANYLRRSDAELFGATGTGVRQNADATLNLP